MKIPESEALEILKVALLDRGLDQPDKNNAIVNGNDLFYLYTRVKCSLSRLLSGNIHLNKDLGSNPSSKFTI